MQKYPLKNTEIAQRVRLWESLHHFHKTFPFIPPGLAKRPDWHVKEISIHCTCYPLTEFGRHWRKMFAVVFLPLGNKNLQTAHYYRNYWFWHQFTILQIGGSSSKLSTNTNTWLKPWCLKQWGNYMSKWPKLPPFAHVSVKGKTFYSATTLILLRISCVQAAKIKSGSYVFQHTI